MSNDARDQIKKDLIQAEADMYKKRGAVLDAVDKIFVDPQRAYSAMQKFMENNTEAALMQRLEKEPYRFGGLKGHFLSGSKWTPIGGAKAIAKETLATLPALVKTTLEAEKNFRSLEKASNHRIPGPLTRDRSRGGPAFG